MTQDWFWSQDLFLRVFLTGRTGDQDRSRHGQHCIDLIITEMNAAAAVLGCICDTQTDSAFYFYFFFFFFEAKLFIYFFNGSKELHQKKIRSNMN